MASLRASETLYDGATQVDNTTAAKASSKGGNVGPMTNVALFISVPAAGTYKIQAAGDRGSIRAGRNGIPLTDGTAETSWYDYHVDQAPTSAETLVFAGAGRLCVDLSPFAPQYIRLVRTDGGAQQTPLAWIVAIDN